MSENPKLSAADIANQISQTEGIHINRRDVINEQAKVNQARFGPRSATQQFLHELEITEGVYYRISRGPQGRIDRIFWTYPWCIDLLRRFPGLLSMDSTYKVNRFNMPLFQATGITCLGSSFNAFFCLISDETEASHTWILQQYKDLLRAYDIDDPYIIITDFDRGLKNAAKDVFPITQQQICVWHIMKNVVHNIKKKWRGPLEGSRLIEGLAPLRSMSREANSTTQLGSDDIRQDVEGRLATTLLRPADQIALNGEVPDQIDPPAALEIVRDPDIRKFKADPDGILSAWEEVVYADTEEDFNYKWATLEQEFQDQLGKLTFLLPYLSFY